MLLFLLQIIFKKLPNSYNLNLKWRQLSTPISCFLSRFVEASNEGSSAGYRHDYAGQSGKLVGLVSSHVDQQKNFCSKQNTVIAESMDRRSKEMSAVTNTYTEAVTKLIEVSNLLFSRQVTFWETIWLEIRQYSFSNIRNITAFTVLW